VVGRLTAFWAVDESIHEGRAVASRWTRGQAECSSRAANILTYRRYWPVAFGMRWLIGTVCNLV
jgi:hypothetical protein